jgi:magnesium chelatase accessory protein
MILVCECKLDLTVQCVKKNLRSNRYFSSIVTYDTPPETGLPPVLPPEWPDRAASTFHEVQGVRWHVQQSGRPKGQAPTLLLVHGTGGSTHSWAGVTAALGPHFHLVNVDLPGHGFTHVPANVERARNPFALHGMARLLHYLLDSLDIRPQLAAGHSAGVSLLLRMTLDGFIAPRQIVGFCSALVAPPAWYVALVAPLLALVLETDAVAHSTARLAAGTRLIERMLGSTGSPLTQEQLARYRYLCTSPQHVHAAIAMMARWDLPSLFREIGTLTVPLRVVAGRQDRWIPVAPLTRAVERIPKATIVVEEGGHLLPEERPEVVVRELLTAGKG